MKRDEYGDPIGGPKISKKQMKKNLMKNEPDEQHNTRMGESTEITEADKKGKGSGRKMLAIIKLSQDTLFGQVHMHQVH